MIIGTAADQVYAASAGSELLTYTYSFTDDRNRAREVLIDETQIMHKRREL